MSYIAETEFGKLRKFGQRYILCCPGCGEWASLDEDQAHGRISVDHATDGCPGGYHETHDFAAAVEAAGGWKVSYDEGIGHSGELSNVPAEESDG